MYDLVKKLLTDYFKVKIERETTDYLYIINKHGLRDKIVNSELGMVDYMSL